MFRKTATIFVILTLALSTSPVQAILCNTDSEDCEMSMSDFCAEDAGLHEKSNPIGMYQDEAIHSESEGCCCAIQTSAPRTTTIVVSLLPGHDQSKTIVGFNDNVGAYPQQLDTFTSLNHDKSSHVFPPKLYQLYASYLI